MYRTFFNALLMLMAFAVAQGAFSAEAEASCPPGKLATQDTGGHCCWPGQAWSGSACVGRPVSCPEGFTYTTDGQGCELLPCAEGLRRTADKVHCCWPGQGWSSAQGSCVGEPQCKRGYIVENGGCVEGPTIRDTDRDLLVDADDQCPEVPEDQDGFQDEDGCPDDDNDADGLVDVDDQCPMDAEDHDGFHDEDGCPEEDNDEDGFADADDQCPNQPEEMENRGVEGEDGCPDDDDQDGVSNSADQCPQTAEDADFFEDGDGCPEFDNDNDGVADAEDACPNRAEDYDFRSDEDGCPDTDDDHDGVADASDICPHEEEDGEGTTPADGCQMLPSEKFAGEWTPDATYMNLKADLHNMTFQNGDGWVLALGVSHTDDALTLGASIGMGVAEGADGLGLAELLDGYIGMYLFSWPNNAQTGFSVLNPEVGAHVSAAMHPFDEQFLFGTGLWIRNTFKIGGFVCGVEYRGFQLAPVAPDNKEAMYTFFVGNGWEFDW